MTTLVRGANVRIVSIVMAVLLISMCNITSESVYAETWGTLFHGPWTQWSSGTTFNGTLSTSDGGYLLTGTSYNYGVIIKVSMDGQLEWSKLIKGNGYQKDTAMLGAVETSNGEFIVTGQVYTDSSINPDAGSEGSWDIYIIRLTSDGEDIWEKVYARKNTGSHPDTHELPQFIYKSCSSGSGSCKYVVTGYVVYSAVTGCPYNGYRASQALVIDDQGVVQTDFLMAGPSATGDGAVKTVYTSDGNYLVLTEQFYANTGLYTTGLQKYGPTGSLLWSKAYYEVYKKSDGEHLLKITAGSVAETADGYVVAGGTYYSVTGDPTLGAYYHFKVDKATGATVAWNKKFRAWANWDSLWILNFATTSDGGLVATIGDGTSTANDRIFKTTQSAGDLLWANEYGANLGAVAPGDNHLAVTASAYDAVLARLSVDGHLGESCKALPSSEKTDEATAHPVFRTQVSGSYSQSGCNSAIGRVKAYGVGLIEAGEYHEANRCAPHPEISVSRNGDFGTVNVGTSGGEIEIALSNYNGLSNLIVANVGLSDTINFSMVSSSCAGVTLYPVNSGTPTSCSSSIRFYPTSSGAKECVVSFSSNFDSPVTATLKGTGAGGAPGDKPVVSITAIDPTASEPGKDKGKFVIARSGGDTSTALAVYYKVGGTARNGKDYKKLSGKVTIPAGKTSANLVVKPIDDQDKESTLSVKVSLKSNASYQLGSPAKAELTIVDND